MLIMMMMMIEDYCLEVSGLGIKKPYSDDDDDDDDDHVDDDGDDHSIKLTLGELKKLPTKTLMVTLQVRSWWF